ncbi:DUF6622 family protein [Nguyenibacter vanlangensis]|uniref:DUF6622 family protein n=1 Tax=Nguyenibacter vanlangensis TaxID=1216886 RepID=A0ABZ3D5S7_9PROT
MQGDPIETRTECPAMSLPMILSHVPLWVWLLLSYLVWQGCAALSDTAVTVRRVALLPLVFVIWGLSGLVAHSGSTATPYLAWLIAAMCLAPVGYRIGPNRMVIDRTRGIVHRKGSPWPLIRNVTLFAAQFAIAIAVAAMPDRRVALDLLRGALSGALAGYFLGWALAFRRRYEAEDGMPA